MDNKCPICQKEIGDNVSVCSSLCLNQLSAKNVGKRLEANSKFIRAFNKMLEPQFRKEKMEINMIVVKHRWMANRNVVFDSVVISFNKEGIAKIPDMGNNREAIEKFVVFSKGLVEFVNEPKIETTKIPITQTPSVIQTSPIVEKTSIEEIPIIGEEEKSTEMDGETAIESDSENQRKPVISKKPIKKPVK